MNIKIKLLKKIMACFLIVISQRVIGISKKQENKLKLYSFYTESHQIYKDKWFLPTLKDDFDVVIDYYEQECPTGLHMRPGWKKTMLRKVEMILRAINQNWGEVFIYADIDIQFFKSIKSEILKNIQDKDLVIQRNTPSGTVCAGFFACRANERTKELFESVAQYMIENNISDQKTLNHFLRKTKNCSVIWDYLPITFFAAGAKTGCGWCPGRVLEVPKKIVLHHANFSEGLDNKLAQLVYVRALVGLHKRLEKKEITSDEFVRISRRLSRNSFSR